GRAVADDRLVARLALLAGLAALGEHAPRRARVAAAGGPALAAAHRVVHRVLAGAAVVRLAALPPHPPGLADADVHVLGVGHLPKRRPALARHAADFPAGHRDLRPVLLAGGQHGAAPGAAADLAALAGGQLDV